MIGAVQRSHAARLAPTLRVTPAKRAAPQHAPTPVYSSRGFYEWGVGDVDVIRVGDTFHLFHLVLPNHNFIAHATSRDGLNWQRVDNALFIGDPGDWDDDMLWTMHVSPHPDGGWRMFYTGLSREEGGRIQRLGVARSDDLYSWTKVTDGYPLELSESSPYEARLDEGRHWVSFRDPFVFAEDGERWLLAAARVDTGPVVRRGCVALFRETSPGHFDLCEPLYHPRLYDDIEVPSVVHFGADDVNDDRYYLIGSVREDVKVHYWHSESLRGRYQNFFDNVLLPQGNYAARVCRDNGRYLIWNFFFRERRSDGAGNMLPPPKELVRNDRGELKLRSFYGFDAEVRGTHGVDALTPLRLLTDNPSASGSVRDLSCWFGCDSAFEAFLLRGHYDCFRLRGTLEMEGSGKCGLLLRLDDDANGYFLSLDLFKGLAQIRAWGAVPGGETEHAFRYDQLQASYFVPKGAGPYEFSLLAFGKYLEFSLGGFVVLSLADDAYAQGAVGFYTESAWLRVDHLELDRLRSPRTQGYEEVT